MRTRDELKINLCNHPTTIVFVDDDKEFLKSTKLGLNELFPCRFYNRPQEALDFLNDQYQLQPFPERYASKADVKYDHVRADIDIRAIHNESKNKERFTEVAVVVIDYSMPQMTGYEFCKQVNNPNLIKLLLTGEAGYDTAVELFNNGYIDQFMKKSASTLTNLGFNSIDTLSQTLCNLQKKYFTNLSWQIVNHKAKPTDFSYLYDQKVATIFEQLCRQYHIVEYYIMDNEGSYLLVDEHGKPRWFILISEQELNNLYESAVYEHAPATVIDALKSRAMIPFFSQPDIQTPLKHWDSHLYPAKQLIGDRNTYYYAIAENPNYPTQLLSYQSYLTNL